MSGLFGVVGTAPGVLAQVQQMGEQLRHHAYQTVETASPAPGVAVGRIGLGLLNRERQPVTSHDGTVSLWLCGEFYHHAPGGQNDAEFALTTYLEAGVTGLTKLNGAFLIAVWDVRAGKLLLVNDRFGLYPHYYATSDSGFIFAPEIKPILDTHTVVRTLDLTAIAEYIRFQQFLGEKTWFGNVRLLPPATVLRVRPGMSSPRLERYWDWDQIGDAPPLTMDEAAEEVIRLFQRAVDAMSKPPLRTGVYLSGGLDSRVILGFLDEQAPVTTITYGAAGCRDVLYAAELARRAGSNHHWFPFKDGEWVREHAGLHLTLTEGMHSWMHSHGMSTLAEARQLINVNLSGWDGGTILGGRLDDYDADRAYREPVSDDELARRMFAGFCKRFTWPGLTDADEAALFSGSEAADLRGRAFESLRAEWSATSHYPADRRADYFYINQHVRRSTQAMIVFGRSAFEVRCPFFDYDLVAFIYSLPLHMRATPQLQREVITRRMPRLALVPNERDNRLPHTNRLRYHAHALGQRARSWTNRHIRPVFADHPRLYADYEHYLRTDLREWGYRHLFEETSAVTQLFDQRAVRTLWERHQSGDELWTIGKIAPLIEINRALRHFDTAAVVPNAPHTLEQVQP